MAGARSATKGRSSGLGRLAAAFWNLLTVVMLVGTLSLAAWFGLIYLDPNSAFNPFPPLPTLSPALALATPTQRFGSDVLPPTWTPTPTSVPTETPQPTETATPTITPTLLVLPSATNTPTPSATPVPRFDPAAGSPSYQVASGRSCSWMGVGGNVVDKAGAPVKGLTVVLGGSYEGQTLRASAVTGSSTNYGEGGYELTIADDPGGSEDTIYIQVLDARGRSLSARIFFDTYDECGRNLIRIDLVQTQ